MTDIIKGTDVFESDFLGNPISSAQNMLKSLKDLETELTKIIVVGERAATALNFNTSGDIAKFKSLQGDLTKQIELKNVVNKESVAIEIELQKLEREKIKTSAAQAKAAQAEERNARKLNGEYDKQSKTLNELRKKYKELALAEKEGTKEAKELLKQINTLDAKLKKVDASVGQFQRSVGNYEKGFSKIGGSISNLAGAFGLTLGVGGLVALGKNILDVTATFQKYQTVLATTLGSQELAAQKLSEIQKLAAATPFSVDELTNSYVKLANRGLLLTNEQLTNLGDLASSTGKSFDQLTEAVLDAQTGENERLKEFGITAKKNGDLITYTFKGQQTVVKNTSKDISDYILSLGKLDGVTGSMAEQSKTLNGQISNLGDNFDTLFRLIGEQGSGVFGTFLGYVNDTIAGLNKALELQSTVSKRLAGTDYSLTSNAAIFGGEGANLIVRQKQLNDLTEKINATKLDANVIDNDGLKLLELKAQKLFKLREVEYEAINNQVKSGQISADTYYKSKILIDEQFKAVGKAIIAERELITNKKKGGEVTGGNLKKIEKEIDLTNELRQARIDAIEDPQKKELEQAQFNFDKRKAEIDKMKADAGQKAALIKQLEENLNADLLKINEKYYNELKKRDEEAINRMQADNDALKLEKVESAFDKELALQDEFNEAKIAKLQALLDEEYALKLAQLQKEANLKLQNENLTTDEIAEINSKLSNDIERLNKQKLDEETKLKDTAKSKDEERNEKQLKEISDFLNKGLDYYEKIKQKEQDSRNKAIDDEITKRTNAIEVQQQRAMNGQENILAFEEEKLAEAELRREKEKKREIFNEKKIAFYRLLAGFAEKDPANAFTKASVSSILGETFANTLGFIEGTENVGKSIDMQKNKVTSGKDGYIARFDGDERILNPEQNQMIGNISNEELARLGYNYTHGLLPTQIMSTGLNSSMAVNMANSLLLNKVEELTRATYEVKEAIKNKPETNIKLDNLGQVIEEKTIRGVTERVTYMNKKNKI